MNKKLALATIALVAVIMVLGTVSPAMAGHDAGKGKSQDDKAEKTEICHKGKTISVSAKAVQKHLDHGDILGPC